MANEKCREMGDFGHTNVWGSPYLMFSVYCYLDKDHTGPHVANVDISIAPSYEKDGLKINRKTVKFVGPSHVRVSWENNS